MRCPECGKEAKRLSSETTMMGFFPYTDKQGRKHDHDPNRVTTFYQCAKRHRFEKVSYHECPVEGCEWVSHLDPKGKERRRASLPWRGDEAG